MNAFPGQARIKGSPGPLASGWGGCTCWSLGAWGRAVLMCHMGLLLWGGPVQLYGQLQVLPTDEPQQVFAGNDRALRVTLRNPGSAPVEAAIRLRLYQASSATAVLVTDTPWKQLQVLPQQTVVEVATVDFPLVRAETRFLVQWIDTHSNVLGLTEVLVYPPDLLKALHGLANGECLGLFDPAEQLKPLLKAANLDFQDLEESGLKAFAGKLAIVGPFASQSEVPEDLPGRIQGLSRKGTGVVWLVPPQARGDQSQPSFCTVFEGHGVVVVAQAALVLPLADRPQAQLNLLQLARLALHAEPARLPHSTPQR